jgi:hypothetical protein
VDVEVSDQQKNVWADNTYEGPMRFDGFNQANTVTWANWHRGFTYSATGQRFKKQDEGSTYRPTCSC